MVSTASACGRIAAAAGVNHALVHRYFGTKSDIVAAILENEAKAMSALARPEADALTSLAALREVFELRAHRRPHLSPCSCCALSSTVWPRSACSTALLCGPSASWQAGSRSRGQTRTGPILASVAMVLGAALMGLAAAQPMLMAGVGPRSGGSGGRAAALRRRACRLRRLYDRGGSGRGPRPSSGAGLTQAIEGA